MIPMTLSIGDKAPDFTLKDQHGQDVTLSSYAAGKAALFRFTRLLIRLQRPIGTERAQAADDSLITSALLLFQLQNFDKCFDRRWHSEFRLCFPCRTDAAEA